MDNDNTVGGVAIESTQLLACPFCGGEAEINKSGFGWFREWTVMCTKCWASTHGYADTNLRKGSRQEAIDTWNRRNANASNERRL